MLALAYRGFLFKGMVKNRTENSLEPSQALNLKVK